MKVLHTADWHLGQKFFHKDRREEHQAALIWLGDFIEAEKIELLIIAGDIFDTSSPPNYARKMYYNFMRRLVNTCCQDIVIVAGNHDSPNMLDASKELFKLLNVHVVGHISAKRHDQIIEIRDKKGDLQAVVGAVPYLRDRDIRKSVAGETTEKRVESIREGIKQHYKEIKDSILPYAHLDIPTIVTGHLYVAGGERGDRQNTIHIGSLDVIDVESFPKEFDYVALGHLHRPQKVGGLNRIRYSGALIPLDFSELNYDQVVKVVNFEGKKLGKVNWIKVPKSRKLRYYCAPIEKIKERLVELDESLPMNTWLKLEIETNTYSPNLQEELTEFLKSHSKRAEIFICNQRATDYERKVEKEEEEIQNLSEITEMEVFQMCLDAKGIEETEARSELEGTFMELMTWMQEREEE